MSLAATAYSQADYGGQAIEFDDSICLTYMHARHPGAQIRSLTVSDGYRARLRLGIDGTGIFTQWFETGDYGNLGEYNLHHSQYHDARSDDQWVMEVAAVDYHPSALAVAYGKTEEDSPPNRFPPGEIKNIADSFWLNPQTGMRMVSVPQWYILTLRDKNGSELELEGPASYDLSAYAWEDRATALTLAPDDCRVVGVTYDYSAAVYSDPQVSELDFAMASNNLPADANDEHPPILLTTMIDFSEAVTETEEWSTTYDIGASMMVGVQAKESVGFLGTGAEVTEEAQFTASFNASFGKGGSAATDTQHEANASVALAPGQTAKISMNSAIQTVSGIKAVRTWENLRTGEQFTDESTIAAAKSLSVTASASLPE